MLFEGAVWVAELDQAAPTGPAGGAREGQQLEGSGDANVLPAWSCNEAKQSVIAHGIPLRPLCLVGGVGHGGIRHEGAVTNGHGVWSFTMGVGEFC